MARIARSAWNRTQSAVVFALCIGASMVLPLSLAAIGFQIA
ncbi:MAG: hypothetical protein AB7O98_15415 [Hyphomonadaceae bacterium]